MEVMTSHRILEVSREDSKYAKREDLLEHDRLYASPLHQKARIFIELTTLDRKLKASRECSQ